MTRPPLAEPDLEEPILFRTVKENVFNATLATGSLWLRSDQYYRELEDSVRNDPVEGGNFSRLGVPLHVKAERGVAVIAKGPGEIGQVNVPHYILSLHGASISLEQREQFGGFTFGVKAISRLAAEIVYQTSRVMKCVGYRYGQVAYQHTSLALTHHQIGSAPLSLGGMPVVFLAPANTDVLRKQPVSPFIEQDEWRIVVFIESYLRGDANEPLRINVDISHFYPYVGLSHRGPS